MIHKLMAGPMALVVVIALTASVSAAPPRGASGSGSKTGKSVSQFKNQHVDKHRHDIRQHHDVHRPDFRRVEYNFGSFFRDYGRRHYDYFNWRFRQGGSWFPFGSYFGF